MGSHLASLINGKLTAIFHANAVSRMLMAMLILCLLILVGQAAREIYVRATGGRLPVTPTHPHFIQYMLGAGLAAAAFEGISIYSGLHEYRPFHE